MDGLTYRYSFEPQLAIDDAEASLLLAVLAAEALYSGPEIRLAAGHYFDPVARVCEIRADSAAGADLSRLFAHFLTTEYGAAAFRVARVIPPNRLHEKAHSNPAWPDFAGAADHG